MRKPLVATDLYMKAALAILVVLTALGGIAIAQSRVESKEVKGKSKGHFYRVAMRVEPAKARNRKITFSSASDPSIAGDCLLINGAKTYGFDGIPKAWVPKGRTARHVLETYATEISRMDVWIDGKRIRIPASKHQTMLMASLTSLSALFSDDGKLLFIFVSGSDGAGSWTARWIIDRKGKVDVEVSVGG